ncbi:GNAT family N-acetyltransferase [Chitinimonas sp.]|uniref:GNAT family N-acetyltransferase n=1 Tax=Chitinimonas sp. TaxID=1934313 RepID=UPI0035AF5CC5
MIRTALLETGDCVIRPLATSDAENLFAAVDASRAEVGAWQDWCTADFGLDQAVAFTAACESGWQAGTEFAFGLFDPADNTVRAVASLNQIQRQHQMANLGYWVHSRHARQGWASKLAAVVARFGIEQLMFHRIEIVAEQANLGSQAVARRLGASLEGLARHRLRRAGESRDAYVFSLIQSDFAA